MDDELARKVEDQLYSLQRQQLERNHPLPLPRSSFWDQVNSLLNHIDNNLNNIVRDEGHSTAAITASRRQSNVRRAMSDLARKRLVALLHHAVTSELRSSSNGEGGRRLPPLDWSRFDAYEREFYDGLDQLLSKFKLGVGWDEMVQGVGEASAIPIVPVGTKQLDDFVTDTGGLTGQGPPPVELVEKSTAEYDEPEFDDEERIAMIEAYPEMMAKANQPIAETEAITSSADNGEISAWDLAPSANQSAIVINDSTPEEATSETSQDEPSQAEPEEKITVSPTEDIPNVLTRIRVLISQDDEIMTAEGDELKLNEGDIHMLDENMAAYLVDAGVAEIAAL